jgi:hypothetical protein
MDKKKRKDWKLSEAQKYEARAAFDALEGSGLTISDCIRIALGRDTVASKKTTLSDAIHEFLWNNLQKQKRGAMRPVTVEWYRKTLEIFDASFDGYILDDFDRAGLKKWFEAYPGASATVNTLHRSIRAMFRWAARQDPPLIKIDPTAGLQLDLGNGKSGPISTFSPEQAHALIEQGGPHKYVYALGLYAGLRPEEIAGRDKPKLDWSAINRQDRIIRISDDIAKTGRVRILEGLSDKLWDILSSGPLVGAISPTETRQSVRCAKEILGLEKWPQDVLRHSFATYDLAMHGDIGRTSLLLGHEGKTSLLFTRYRGVRRKVEAERYFQ